MPRRKTDVRCPRCGRMMSPGYGHAECAACRDAAKFLQPCPNCGRLMNTALGYATCSKCRHTEANRAWNKRWITSNRGRRQTTELRCNFCHTKIICPTDYDPRYVRFCERCRNGIVRDIEMANKMTRATGSGR